VTIGRGGTATHILASEDTLNKAGITVHVSDRGGDVTYHGPGQLVCYPIVDLAGYDRDVHAHARRLEAVIMQSAASFGVASWRKPGFPGVWTTRGKIGAIGAAVRRWVTTHGAALNVCPDMRAFSLIVPCGLSGMAVTSLAEIKGHAVDLTLARGAMRDACERVFHCSLVEAARHDLVPTAMGIAEC
jgi:lipoate-protein ligase B